jgi:hypothetical protein
MLKLFYAFFAATGHIFSSSSSSSKLVVRGPAALRWLAAASADHLLIPRFHTVELLLGGGGDGGLEPGFWRAIFGGPTEKTMTGQLARATQLRIHSSIGGGGDKYALTTYDSS